MLEADFAVFCDSRNTSDTRMLLALHVGNLRPGNTNGLFFADASLRTKAP